MAFQEMLGRARDGDTEALNALLEQCRDLLRQKAQAAVHRSDQARFDTSDLLQESLLKISQDVFSFRGTDHSEWQSWLRAILHARARAMHRRHHAGRRSVAAERAVQAAAVSPRKEPLEQMIEQENRQYVAEQLESLTERTRDVVVRRVVEHQSFQEIADSLGCSPGAVRVMWTRALKTLSRRARRDAT